jgi:hypothetical protein
MPDEKLSIAGDDEWLSSPEAAEVAKVERAERAKFEIRRAAEAEAASAERTVRLNVNLSLEEHRQFSQWALDAGTDKSTLTRAMLALARDDPEFAGSVEETARR